MKKEIYAELIKDKLVVWDSSEGSELYRMGFYGKPVGISKPKNSNFDVPLLIDLIEGLYLFEKKIIKVSKGSVKEEVDINELRVLAKKLYINFELNYMVYKNLKDSNYVVLPGIKFGCDFAIYEKGPGIDHAPYLVSVKKSDDEISSTDIVRAGRLATSVRKRFIIAVPNLETGKIQYLMFNWFKA